MKLLAPFALIVIVLAGVIWLDDTPTDADLVFVNQNEVFTLDPQRMSYVQDLRLAHLLYEGLVRWNNFDFSIVPAVAADMPAISDDGRTYTFHLRDDAKWSNGQPVTAHDFIYSWMRAILPDTAADYSNLFFAIDGAEAFFAWRARQTRGLVADPWEREEPFDADSAPSVAALFARLRALAEHDRSALPRAIFDRLATAPAPDRVLAELDRLESTLRAERWSDLDADLAEAAACRAWAGVLELVRPDEAAWMWEQVERRFAETVGLRALGDHVLEVRLRRPTPYFLDLLCFGVFFPVHRPTVEGWPDAAVAPDGWHLAEAPPFEERRWVRITPDTGKFEQKHAWARPDHHVGNGTHRLAQWRYKRDLRLERNRYFHTPEQIRTDSILALTIEDTNTAVLAFESGRVDWLADVSAEYESDMIAELQRYQAHYQDRIDAGRANGLTMDEILASLPPPGSGERRNIRAFPTFGTEFFSFNCRPELAGGATNPFKEPLVRRAFCAAINKRTIVDQVTRLHEPVATTLIPPGSIDGYPSPTGLAHDPDLARRLLAEAGWKDHDGDGLVDDGTNPFPVVDLLYTTNVPRYKWISLNLKSQWERELGVSVELRPAETKFYREDLKRGRFMIARGRWYGDYGDPTTFLDLCRTNDGNNDRKYSNTVVDDMLDEAATIRDPDARMRTLADVEEILFGPDGDHPMIVLCQLRQVYMYEPGRVRGLSTHPRLTQFLWQMQVQDR
ncbi:MAG: peptide ABC transporter substrate-binding protein [Planctomycetota bacterium]|jgi:oligopeptide transport system substrate-binding protein